MTELFFSDARSQRKMQLFFTGEEIEQGEFEAIKNLVTLRDVQEFRNGDFFIVHVGVTYENRAVLEKLSFYHPLNIHGRKRGLKLADIIELKRLSGL